MVIGVLRGVARLLAELLAVFASNLTLTLAPPALLSSMLKVPASWSAVSVVSLRVSSGLAVPEYLDLLTVGPPPSS
jgi:hypothetical protein